MTGAMTRRLAALVLLLAACHRDMPGDPGGTVAAVLVRVGGDGPHATGLATLEEPLAIRATEPATLAPIAGLAIRFSVDNMPAGGAHLSDTLAVTNRDGVARTELTLVDGAVDQVFVSARVGHGPAERFTVFVSPAPVVRRITPGTVRSGDTVTLLGEGLRIAGAPGVVRFDGTPVRAISATDSIVRAIVPPCLTPGTIAVTVTNGGARTAPAPLTHLLRNVPMTLAPLEGAVLRASQLADCVVLAGDSARYLVIAQVESERSEEHTSELQSP
jgi:hypothetical protein